jgi:uncharacterized membrane protein YbhN (UPF0104 family)
MSKKIVAMIRIIVIGILITLFFWHVDLRLFSNYLNLRIFSIILIVQPFILLSNVLVAYRLSMLLKNPPASFMLSFKATILSIGLNSIFPAQLSQMFKVSYLRDHAGIPVGSILAGIFMEKLIDLFLIGLLALISVGLLLGNKTNTIYVFFFLILFIAFVLLIPFLEKPLLKLSSCILLKPIKGIIEKFIIQLSSQMKKRVFYISVVYGAIAILISILGMKYFLRSIGSIPIKISEVLGIYVATSVFGSALTALPGGFGTYEASVAFMLKKFGYSLEEALVLSFALHLSQILLFFFLSLIVVSRERLGFFTLIKKIRNEEKK